MFCSQIWEWALRCELVSNEAGVKIPSTTAVCGVSS